MITDVKFSVEMVGVPVQVHAKVDTSPEPVVLDCYVRDGSSYTFASQFPPAVRARLMRIALVEARDKERELEIGGGFDD